MRHGRRACRGGSPTKPRTRSTRSRRFWRGTSSSDRMPPGDVVRILDAYFDRVAGAVTEHGGEVLKFVGDAILAIFPIGQDVAHACRQALRAAEDGLAALAQLNEERAPEDPLAMGVALHLGEVMYGNIGSRERLDFTVISSS